MLLRHIVTRYSEPFCTSIRTFLSKSCPHVSRRSFRKIAASNPQNGPDRYTGSVSGRTRFPLVWTFHLHVIGHRSVIVDDAYNREQNTPNTQQKDETAAAALVASSRNAQFELIAARFEAPRTSCHYAAIVHFRSVSKPLDATRPTLRVSTAILRFPSFRVFPITLFVPLKQPRKAKRAYP